MANQAIALQARTPQTDILGGAIQRNAQMMNMMAQQSAAERQAMQAQQAMELARAEEGRAVTKAELEARKANQEYIASRVKYFNDQLPSVKDDAGWNNWLNRVAREDNEYADELRRMSGGRYDPDFVSRVSMDAKTFIDKTIPTPEASLQYGEGGGAFGITVGGAGAPTAREVIVQPSAGAPAQTPMSAFPTPGAPATDAQIDEAARKILRGAGTAELGIGADDFDRATERANQMTAGGEARMQPISMTTGPQMGGQPDFKSIVDDMLATKQVSASNVQLMRAEAAKRVGPQADAQLAQMLKDNNIQIVPDGQPGMRSAEFRPGEDAAPQMQLAQATNAPGTQFRGRDPLQSPMPGSAIVPLPRVRAEAEAQREPIPQTAARAEAQREPIPQAGARAAETERASKQAQADVEFLEKYQSDKRTAQEALMLINRMIGDTNLIKGRLIYKNGGDGPHAGFEDVVGATWRPGWRLVPGTAAADFDKMLGQIKGAAFLTAYERLKGGGPIATIEGEKGTAAVTRLDRDLSEKEFVAAARELEASIRDAIRRADERYARVKGIPSTRQGATVDELVRKYGG